MNKVHFPSTRLHPLGCHPKLLLFPSIRDHETSHLNHVTKSSDPHAGSLPACCSSSSFHCHILLHWVVLPYFPWMKHWCPSQNLSALVQLLSHQHRASNLGLWRTACVAQLSSGSWMPLGQADLQHSWPSHPMLSLRLMFWGSVTLAPQVHQAWCMPNHQLYCEGAVRGGILVSQRQARALQLWCC